MDSDTWVKTVYRSVAWYGTFHLAAKAEAVGDDLLGGSWGQWEKRVVNYCSIANASTVW